MPKDSMEKFDKIAEEAIDSAEQVDCDLLSFYQGLKNIISTLQTRMECASSDDINLNDLVD